VTRPVVVLPEAEQDLAEAFTWYEEQRAGLGGAFLNEAASLFEQNFRIQSQRVSMQHSDHQIDFRTADTRA
jgi:hypothetical protein